VGYIGQQPAPKVITSSDLSADVVTEAKIADNAVENEHLNANVITGHTALGATPADTDELLVSDAGTLKRVDFSYLKGGGAFEKLVTTSSASVASVIFNNTYFTTTYRDYRIVITGMRPASNATTFQMQISSDNGSSFISSANYKYVFHSGVSNVSTTYYQRSNGNDKFELQAYSGVGTATGETCGFIIDIFDPLNQNGDNNEFMFTARNGHKNSDAVFAIGVGGGVYEDGSGNVAYNAVRFKMSSGNIDQGQFTLYGRKI
jgi:hypothetical protein